MSGHYLRFSVAGVYQEVSALATFLVDTVGWEIAENASDTGDVRDVVLKSAGEPEVPNVFPRYIRIRNASGSIHLHTYETFTSTTINTGELDDSTYAVVCAFENPSQGFEVVVVADLERVIITHYPYTGTNNYTGYIGRINSYYQANTNNYPNLVKGSAVTTYTWYYSAAETHCFMIGPHGSKQHYHAIEPLNSTGLEAGATSDRDGANMLTAPVLVNTDVDSQRSELVGEPRGVYRISPEVSAVNSFVKINGEVYVTSVQSGVHMAMGPVGTDVPPLTSAAQLPNEMFRAARREEDITVHWDETTIQSVSGTVTAWVDKTGNGWDLVPGTTAPLHLVANQNGLDTVDCFTGSGYMDLDVSGGAPMSGTSPGTFYMVLITDTAPGVNGQSPLDVTDGPSGNHHPWTDNKLFNDFGTTSRRSWSQNPAAVIHDWHVFSGVSATGNCGFDINSVLQFSTTSNTVSWRPTGAAPWVVGGGQTGSYKGRIGEVRLYAVEHDTFTRAYITQILKNKWGIL